MLKRRRLPVPRVTPAQREILEQWVRRPTSAQALALRARIVLRLGEGHSSAGVARQLRIDIQTVSKWRERFVAQGVDGLLDEPRPGQPRKISDPGKQTRCRHPLVQALDGPGQRTEP